MYNCNSEPISIGDAFQLERISGVPGIAPTSPEEGTVDHLAEDLRTRLTEGSTPVSAPLDSHTSP